MGKRKTGQVLCQRCRDSAREATVHVELRWADTTWALRLCRTHALTLRRMLDGWAGRPLPVPEQRQLSLKTTVPPSVVQPLRPLQEDVEDR